MTSVYETPTLGTAHLHEVIVPPESNARFLVTHFPLSPVSNASTPDYRFGGWLMTNTCETPVPGRRSGSGCSTTGGGGF